MKIRLVLILLIVSFLVACATTPTGRSQLAFMPDSEVDAMGLQAFDNLKNEKAISSDERKVQFVQCIADAITREVDGEWEVVVFDDNTLNAFALPGGKIGVHTGLINLVDNQDQLASVMGHEVGHVLAKHSNERMSQKMGTQLGVSLVTAVAAPQTAMGQTAISLLGVGAQYGVIMPFSRLHESEADIIGIELMAKAGFLQATTLRQKRRYAIILIFVLAAFLTPPDVLSQVALALPLIILYELTIYFMARQEKAQNMQQKEHTHD